jgi:hypothetical protein
MNLKRLFAEQEHGLRQSYADWILRMLGTQFLIVGVVAIVSRHLFPNRDGQAAAP